MPKIYEETGGTEIAILDCIGFLRHFLHLFHRIRVDYVRAYQTLVLNESDSAVSQTLKEAFLALRQPLRLENSREVKPLNSKKIGDRLKNAGFWVSYESHYLLERNWIQLCLMSDVPKAAFATLPPPWKTPYPSVRSFFSSSGAGEYCRFFPTFLPSSKPTDSSF